jgi:hypothetical protein
MHSRVVAGVLDLLEEAEGRRLTTQKISRHLADTEDED